MNLSPRANHSNSVSGHHRPWSVEDAVGRHLGLSKEGLKKLGIGIAIVAAVALGLLACFVCIRKHFRTLKRRKAVAHYCGQIPANETIFVSIPSYRDQEAVETVIDLFEKARCPRRVFVGVCSQIAPEDESFLAAYRRRSKRRSTLGPLMDNIRVLEFGHTDARGPMYARSLIESRLYRGEQFYMMTDSHMVFAKDWDALAIGALRACPSGPQGRRSVLTTYPADISIGKREGSIDSILGGKSGEDDRPQESSTMPAYLRFKCFNATNGMPEIEGPAFARKPTTPVPSLFWGACFSFGYAKELIEKVPFDPHAHYVFFGEETSYAARLFTNGFDLYSPSCTLAFHRWNRGGRSTFWELFDPLQSSPEEVHRRRQLESIGYDRVRCILGMKKPDQVSKESLKEIDLYGLGDQRTLREFMVHCGVDFSKRQASGRAFMGISPNARTDEIVCKYGTITRYSIERKRMCGQE